MKINTDILVSRKLKSMYYVFLLKFNCYLICMHVIMLLYYL